MQFFSHSPCSHSVLSAAYVETLNLDKEEKQKILRVLRRNDLFEAERDAKVKSLQAELSLLKRRGAIRVEDAANELLDNDLWCGRCRSPLGRIVSRGWNCKACHTKVCRKCRIYIQDNEHWVCNVCHKQMEIQAVSGEWMNEFVRRPSRRRDHKTYVPTADIIKACIHRSSSISDSTRNPFSRAAQTRRLYNSLPRSYEKRDFPSLQQFSPNLSEKSALKVDPVDDGVKSSTSGSGAIKKERINPLIKHASKHKISDSDSDSDLDYLTKMKKKEIKQLRRSHKNESDNVQSSQSRETSEAPQELPQCAQIEPVTSAAAVATAAESKDEPVEPAQDFRKVTIRKKSGYKKMASDTGWRRSTDADLLDISLPEGDEYKLVFLSSDSSSKEEDPDDNDSTSTGSSFPIDECDWDYFEPGVKPPAFSWTSPVGSPRVYRKEVSESPIGSPIVIRRARQTDAEHDCAKVDVSSTSSAESCKDKERADMDDVLECVHQGKPPLRQKPCRTCGCATQYVPIPVPVPIPIPMMAPQWMNAFPRAETPLIFYSPEMLEAFRENMRVLPRAFCAYFNQSAGLWPLINSEPNPLISALLQNAIKPAVQSNAEPAKQQKEERVNSSETPSTKITKDIAVADEKCYSEESANVTESECRLKAEMSDDKNAQEMDDSMRDDFCSDSSCDEMDSKDLKRRKSRVYVVNSASDESSYASEIEDGVNVVVLTRIKSIGEFADDQAASVISDCDKNWSAGSCDASAESMHSIEPDRSAYIENEEQKVMSNSSRSSHSNSNSNDKSSSEWNECMGIRSDEPVSMEGTETNTRCFSEQTGVEIETVNNNDTLRHAARYKSLIMITQDSPYTQPVNVVTSDTTTFVPDNDIVVRHTNWKDSEKDNGKPAGYFTLKLDTPETAEAAADSATNNTLVDTDAKEGKVTVITGADTLSAVVCLEEGLADDDSWVEEMSHCEEDFEDDDSNDSSSNEEVTLHCSAALDHEDELGGYHRKNIDFTLYTIMEESCEESEVEQQVDGNAKQRPMSATDLEKYFCYGIVDGNANESRDDAFSETSSICSETMDSLSGAESVSLNNENVDPMNDMNSSSLETYFLRGITSFKERRDSDGSVGSDSEGKPSPEQRRKRLVRARGTGRSHSSSLDNLIASNNELSAGEQNNENPSEHSSSSDSDTYDEANSFEKNDGQFDTVKRQKKNKKQRNSGCGSPLIEEPASPLENNEVEEMIEEENQKVPLPTEESVNTKNKQQSRDSGFIGSNDDLNKDTRDTTFNNDASHEQQNNASKSEQTKDNESNQQSEENPLQTTAASSTFLTRKDSFNNWSSDEETNLMMCKMRQFFKTMVANNNVNSKPTTPILGPKDINPVPSPRLRTRCKPPQLVYFENELTRLMKTVPGIRDDQVREIVEYLSSEDTWSDSYDSSDYTSSDLEGANVTSKSVLQQQISASCKQIINNFDTGADDEGDEGDGGIESHGLNRETAFVYQKLVASFEKMATGDKNEENNASMNSPPLIAKVMHHIGSRLVALMHEVSSGESHASNSPKTRYHRRLAQKMSSCSTTTTEDDDSTSDSNLADKLSNLEESMTAYNLLPRSRSHDLLLSEAKAPNQSSITDIAEERETSDCERFSWRGSFESALLATDSRNKLSLIGGESSASASALAIAAKRRSAGDLLFSNKSLSREQLDRVRSCGSIGGANSEDKLWVTCSRPNRRRSSVPDAGSCSGASADGEEDDEDDELEIRATLPRSLQSSTATTNSLPRLPTNTHSANMQKAQSMYHFSQPSVKSARYRPPGFNRNNTSSVPKRAVSAPGLQPTPQRRGRRQQTIHDTLNDDSSISENQPSPMIGISGRLHKSATPSPVASRGNWSNNEEDIDKLVDLYKRTNLGSRSDSMASVYSGTGEGRYGAVAVRGQVEFSLQYNYKSSDLEIHVKQCKDLAAVDIKRNRSDPYVKIYLLPDKSKSGKRKTKIKKHTLNPVFDECLKYHVPLSDLDTRKLWLTVWHSDMFGRNDFLGEITLALQSKVFDDPAPQWYTLQERSEPFEEPLSFRGDIYLGLKFVPPDLSASKKGKLSKGSLHVRIKQCKQITAVKGNGSSDAFCKSYLLPDKGRSSKKKTSIIRKTVNPVWNHTFTYEDVSLQELAERCLELTVWDHDILGSNEFIGGVRFSLGAGTSYGKPVDWMDSAGKEVALWKSMLKRPNLWVEGCLPLRSTLEHKCS